MEKKFLTKVSIVPGNGCTPVRSCNWYQWLQKELEKKGIKTFLENMPDPYEAKSKIWLPFMKNKLEVDENTLLIGHSSGAEAAMRYMEKYKVGGCFLVSPCVTDMGKDYETISGYYPKYSEDGKKVIENDWNWEKMKENCDWIEQFSGEDDRHVSYESEQIPVNKNLGTKLHVFKNKGHFLVNSFPELLEVILKSGRFKI